jgi:hypothetical protein
VAAPFLRQFLFKKGAGLGFAVSGCFSGPADHASVNDINACRRARQK